MFYTNAKVWGNQILYRYVDSKGNKKMSKVPFKPTLYIPSNKGNSKFKSIEGEQLAPVNFDSISEAKQFIKQYEHVDNFRLFGNTGWNYQFLAEEYKDVVKYDAKHIRIAYLDIEVNSSNGFPEPDVAKEPVTAITFAYDGIVHTFGCKDYTPKKNSFYADHVTCVTYHKCENEYELLRQFLFKWKNLEFDIVTGWNVEGFDLPYLVNRITKIVGPEQVKQLSPWGIITKRTRTIKMNAGNVERTTFELYGISTLDYMDAYKKFTYDPRESYSLHFIADEELEDTKIEYDSELGLHGLYDEDYETFIDYNIKDVTLVQRIEQKKNILKLLMFLAYNSKTNYEDTFSQVRMWDALIYNHLLAQNTIIPFKEENTKDEKYPGAYVMFPQTGKHKYMATFDLASLYPSLFVQYNVGPETLCPNTLPVDVEMLLEKQYEGLEKILRETNVALAANGCMFTKEKTSFMVDIVLKLFDHRKAAKKKMLECEQAIEHETDQAKALQLKSEMDAYNIMQLGIKTTMNSMYGAVGTEYFRFFDVRLATAITKSGQLALLWARKAVNKFINDVVGTEDADYIIYGDTDSIHVSLDALVEKVAQGRKFKSKESAINLMDDICKKQLTPVIEAAYQYMFEYTNGKRQMMIMKREALIDGAIYVGKKRYAYNVWDSEGVRYTEPKMKVKGLEIVRSSTPNVVRKDLKESVRIMLASDDATALRKYVEDCKEKFMQLPPDAIAFPRGVSDIEKYATNGGMYYGKGAPAHVKASIIYNRLLKEKGVDKKYRRIDSGEKIKWIYLKVPNPVQEESIAFRSKLPPEFELDKYVDKKVQFEKAFVSPINNILEVIGWTLEEVSTLEAFFV